MRVVLVVTINGSAQSIIDGVTTNVETQPGEGGVSRARRQGQGPVGADGHHRDTRACRFPAMPPSVRVLLILAKYAALGVIPLVIPSILDIPPLPMQQIPQQRGSDYAYVKQLAARGRLRLLPRAGPGAGHLEGLLGSGDPRRRAAAGADHQHGRADQRRAAVVQLRQGEEDDPDRLLPGAVQQGADRHSRSPTSRRSIRRSAWCRRCRPRS